jgi:hypothetical protein
MDHYRKHERGFSKAGVRRQESGYRSIGVRGFSDGFDSATPERLKSIILGPRSREQVGSKPLEQGS